MKRENVKRIIADSVLLVGFLLLIASLLMFLILNEGVFFSSIGMGIFFVLALAILPIGYILSHMHEDRKVDNRSHRWMAIFALAIAIIMLVCCILFALVIDLFQPIVLNSTNNVLLIVACVLILVGAFVELIFDQSRVSAVASVMLIVVMLVGIIWANVDGYKSFNNDVITNRASVFENGESGYATFRIPSIVALDKDDINAAKDYTLKHDILLATAEGRKGGSHDTGSIDMVGKVSKDGGYTWGELMVIYSYKDEIGKYGNPTPVLDRETGDLVFPYMTATAKNGYDYSTYVAHATIESNGDITFPDPKDNIDISFEKGNESQSSSDGVRSYTLMVGPGKSIQLSNGRLIIPASGGGHSFVMYSDDHGYTWKQGGFAGEGNECEAVELIDKTTGESELCMVVRDNTGCCVNHFEQYQRLSYSKDGGKTWYKQTEDTSLRSTICMSSVDKLADGTLLISYPDSFYTRVNLTIGTSQDKGATFKTTSLYGGPAGYSCITVDSDGNVYLLAEIGRVNYNEELIFMKIDSTQLNK